MLNTNKLKGKMVENNITQLELAEKLEMSVSTFSRKLHNGTFGIDEANKMIDILKIDNPIEIFFGR